MRKALIVLLSFLVMFGVGACTYNAYMTTERALDLAHIGYRNSTVNGNNYSVQVRSKVFGRPISGFDYDMEDGRLFFTVYYRASQEDLMEIYKDEYVKIDIKADEPIDEVYYRFKGKETALSFEQYLKADEVEFKNLSLDVDGVFKGTFRSTVDGKKLYKYTQKVEDDNLYISFSCSAKNAIDGIDEQGFATIEIDTKRDINAVYIRRGNSTVLLIDKQSLNFSQISTKDIKLENNNFSGKFSCDIDGKHISDYSYTVENGNLYLTLHAKNSATPYLEEDADGYVSVNIANDQPVSKAFYRFDKADSELTVAK